MSRSYTGWRARYYERLWPSFTRQTLSATLEMVDFAALRRVPECLGRPPRALDVACGTGLLLAWLLDCVPDLEVAGVDRSADMLAQARAALASRRRVRLELAELGAGPIANLPYPPATFDLITCTNAIHYLPDPTATLAGLSRLLAPGGQLVIEDYARRAPPFPWLLFEWLIRRVDPGHVRAYTLAEAQALSTQAGFAIVQARAFTVNWLWHAWALRAITAPP